MLAHGAGRFTKDIDLQVDGAPATLIRTKNTHRPRDAIDRQFLEGVLRDRIDGGQ